VRGLWSEKGKGVLEFSPPVEQGEKSISISFLTNQRDHCWIIISKKMVQGLSELIAEAKKLRS
jgi:hypothetical protein